MNDNEKHNLLTIREAELHEQLKRTINMWEENNGIWITQVDYIKTSRMERLQITTALVLGK